MNDLTLQPPKHPLAVRIIANVVAVGLLPIWFPIVLIAQRIRREEVVA